MVGPQTAGSQTITSPTSNPVYQVSLFFMAGGPAAGVNSRTFAGRYRIAGIASKLGESEAEGEKLTQESIALTTGYSHNRDMEPTPAVLVAQIAAVPLIVRIVGWIKSASARRHPGIGVDPIGQTRPGSAEVARDADQ
jgi:hypothetical protein